MTPHVQRNRKLEAYYPAQLARQARRYARMKSRREPMPKGRSAKPWNDLDCDMMLHVCPSVKALLGGKEGA